MGQDFFAKETVFGVDDVLATVLLTGVSSFFLYLAIRLEAISRRGEVRWVVKILLEIYLTIVLALGLFILLDRENWGDGLLLWSILVLMGILTGMFFFVRSLLLSIATEQRVGSGDVTIEKVQSVIIAILALILTGLWFFFV